MRALSLIGEIPGRSGSESALRRRFAVSGQAEILSVVRLDFADLTAAEFARFEEGWRSVCVRKARLDRGLWVDQVEQVA